MQDERHHLRHADAGRGDRGRDLPALQVPDVQRGPADGGRGHQGDEGPRHLDQQRAEEPEPVGDEPRQRDRRADVRGRRQGQRDDPPVPFGLVHHAAQAGPGQLAGQQVGGGGAGHHRQQGAEPDALQPHRGDLGAGHRRDQFGAQGRQQVPVAAQRLARGAGQHDRLQQRHHGQQLLRARFLQGEAGGAVRADVEGEFGQELGDVQADLQVAGCHVAVAGVEQHGLAAAGEQDPVRGQPPVGHLAGVQPGDRVPDVPELVVAAPGIAPGQRGAVVNDLE